MSIFLLLVLVHLIGDFVLQTDSIARGKRIVLRARADSGEPRNQQHRLQALCSYKMDKRFWWHIAHHTILSFVVALIAMNQEDKWVLLWLPILTGVTHTLIDILKIVSLNFVTTHTLTGQGGGLSPSTQATPRPFASVAVSGQLLLFLLDQALHIYMIFIIIAIYSRRALEQVLSFMNQFVQGGPLHLDTLDKLLGGIILTISATAVSSAIVQIVAIPPESDLPDDTSVPFHQEDSSAENMSAAGEIASGHDSSHTINAARSLNDTKSLTLATGLARRGRTIGYLERLILAIIVSMGAYAAITFIVAAKSLIRLRKFEETAFAEYFLVGTLTSMLCGTLCGLLLKRLFM